MNHTLCRFPNAEALAAEAAVRWLSAMDLRDSFTVALSGGRIPKLLYAAVAAEASPDAFANAHFFWGDERCVSPTDEESNFKLAAVRLLLAMKVPEAQVHRILTERGEAFAVQQAEAEICRIADLDDEGQPILDLVFLGLGEDGHVASLFPGDSEALDSPSVYRAVTGPKPPPRRITLGFPALAAAREVWVLASGEGKKNALRASLAPDGNTPLARVLQSRTHTEIFTDFNLA
ncbi:MAG: 6-phosphogluconolactonase [Verrucomicrobia subdivision 3 bacterium]|nr:6-phosphogluconolactonase [Limisphaerales bacterium]